MRGLELGQKNHSLQYARSKQLQARYVEKRTGKADRIMDVKVGLVACKKWMLPVHTPTSAIVSLCGSFSLS